MSLAAAGPSPAAGQQTGGLKGPGAKISVDKKSDLRQKKSYATCVKKKTVTLISTIELCPPRMRRGVQGCVCTSASLCTAAPSPHLRATCPCTPPCTHLHRGGGPQMCTVVWGCSGVHGCVGVQGCGCARVHRRVQVVQGCAGLCRSGRGVRGVQGVQFPILKILSPECVGVFVLCLVDHWFSRCLVGAMRVLETAVRKLRPHSCAGGSEERGCKR